MKFSIFTLAFLTTSTAFAVKPESLSHYLEIHSHLASDKFSGVTSLASKIAESEKGNKAGNAAKQLSQSKDIKEARSHFKHLSQEIIASTSKKDLGDLKVASCPMAKAKWIQKEVTIKNPYYGASMLECGSIE